MYRFAISAIISFFILSCAAQAESLPSFELGIAAWQATNIVVVDSKGNVLENWKGNLPIGSRIPTDAWQIPANETVHYGYFEKDPVRHITSSRRVFFLVRVSDGSSEVAESWKPADLFRQMSTSVAWIENRQSFAVQQWMNPGPALVYALNLTEAQLNAEVLRLVDLQQDMRNAVKEQDPLARAERLVSFLRPRDRWAFRDALEELTNCGQPAWRVIRRLLTQDEWLPIHRDLIHVAEKTAGPEAITELERIVREDAQYWLRIVEAGQIPVPYNPPMSDHYYRLSSCLFVLKRLGYRDPHGLVAKLRADWDAVPRLAHLGSGAGGEWRSPILRYADQILATQ